MKRLLLVATLALASCGDGGGSAYMKIHTGGIAFDRNHKQATMSAVVKALKPLPEGGELSARFETSAATFEQVHPAQYGQLLYRFEISAEASEVPDSGFHLELLLRDAAGKDVERLVQDFGGMVDKHAIPRHSDMVPDRERQVRQYNDEGF